MINVEQHGPVTVIRMARALFGRPLYWTAAYLLDGLLIDSGPVCTANELLRLLDGQAVEQVVVTHSHEDHIGGLAAIRARFPDIPIYAPRAALPFIEEPALLRMQRYRRLIWGAPAPQQNVRSLDEVEDAIRTPQFTLRAIETPGHSRDHVSYFEPTYRWLFCGDAFIGGRDVAWSPDFDMFAIVSSLRTMAALRPERLFPGSGTVRRTPLADLQGKIGDLIQLCSEVMRLETAGYSVGETVEMLLGGEPRLRLWTMGHLSAANLVDACHAYNAITAPAGATLPTLPTRRKQRKDLPDPPASQSTDAGDRRR